MNTQFSKIIKELIDSGMTQAEIARRCATSQGYISDMINGRRKCPNWILGDALIRLHRKRKSKRINVVSEQIE